MQNDNVCRFCLKLVHDTTVELIINGVTKTRLAFLLIKLDLDVSEDPLACKICLSILNDIYTFKSTCLQSEDIIRAHFDSNIKDNPRDTLVKLGDGRDVNIAGDEVVCRLCTKIPPNSSYIALNETSMEVSHCRDMMQMQLPEINLNITEEPVICEACYELLKNYSSFATNCLNVEQKIKLYCEHQRSDVTEQVDLQCVVQFTENKALDCENGFIGGLVVKQEESSVHVKVETIEKDNLSKDHFTDGSSIEFYIKEEEVEIKPEVDQISCDQYKNRPKVILQCNHCDYRTKNKTSLCLHKKTHNPLKHIFKCEQCEYSTYRRTRFNEHVQTHNVLRETVMFYCATCDFKSKYKRSVHYHSKGCSKNKDGTDSRVMLQCNQCDYHTIYSNSLSVHKKTHNPAKYRFQCEQCEYSTFLRSSLNRHLLTHMELGETAVYYCATCNFKSKYKKSLVDHLKRCSKEDDTDSRTMLDCNQCDFRTKCKKFLLSHKKIHDPTKYKFKCDQCEYCSYDRSNLNRHLLSHMKLGETELYYCGTCQFKTKYKNNLTFHMKNCSKKKDDKKR